MSEKLKQKIESLIEDGYSKEDILFETKAQIFQTNENLVFNRTKEDVLSKITIFFISGILIWFLLAFVTSGIIYLIDIGFDELITVILLSLITLLSIYISYRLARKTTYENSIRNIINLGILPYLAELILPSILTYLLFLFSDEKDSYNSEEVAVSFSIIFFVLVILEWLRRYRDKNTSSFFKYLYVVIMIVVFAFGLWYAKELAS